MKDANMIAIPAVYSLVNLYNSHEYRRLKEGEFFEYKEPQIPRF